MVDAKALFRFRHVNGYSHDMGAPFTDGSGNASVCERKLGPGLEI